VLAHLPLIVRTIVCFVTPSYAAIMDKSAFDIVARERAYRSTGWKGYDPTAPAYAADQVRKERELYRL
jgi:hypothetical protein